jgi:hypothetical protein
MTTLIVLFALGAAPCRAAAQETLPERVRHEVLEPALQLIRDAARELADPDSNASLVSPTPLLAPASPPAKRLAAWIDEHWIEPLTSKAESRISKTAHTLADPRVMTPPVTEDYDEEDENVKEEVPEPADEPQQALPAQAEIERGDPLDRVQGSGNGASGETARPAFQPMSGPTAITPGRFQPLKKGR